jgi:hypothetical protein
MGDCKFSHDEMHLIIRKILFHQPHSDTNFERDVEEVVAPIPLKLVRAFSEESHSVNTIRQVFFVIAIYLNGGGWEGVKKH